jgi:transcriptional regulator with XRE-family HTH domain
MSEIVKRFGQRVKFYRTQMGVSQEKFAEMCGLHPTYIGQVERGEKNCTLESAGKISKGLGIPLERLVSKISSADEGTEIADEIYDIAVRNDGETQEKLLKLINLALKFNEKN